MTCGTSSLTREQGARTDTTWAGVTHAAVCMGSPAFARFPDHPHAVQAHGLQWVYARMYRVPHSYAMYVCTRIAICIPYIRTGGSCHACTSSMPRCLWVEWPCCRCIWSLLAPRKTPRAALRWPNGAGCMCLGAAQASCHTRGTAQCPSAANTTAAVARDAGTCARLPGSCLTATRTVGAKAAARGSGCSLSAMSHAARRSTHVCRW